MELCLINVLSTQSLGKSVHAQITNAVAMCYTETRLLLLQCLDIGMLWLVPRLIIHMHIGPLHIR